MARQIHIFSFSLLLILITLFSCSQNQEKETQEENNAIKNEQAFDWQGHRGARGLMPENTLPAFIKALDLGMNTLELDAVITKDKKVVLSHEPILSPEICLDSLGNAIDEGIEWRIYEMEYATLEKCDCGSKPTPRFPQQEKMVVVKPLLPDMIDLVEQYAEQKGLPKPFYNIETKSTPEGDGVYHPAPEEFVDLLVNVLEEKEITERTYIQSFDVRTLQVAQQKYPAIKLVLLIDNEDSAEENLEKLGFTPAVYSPYHPLVTKELVGFIHREGMQIIPWTVNTPEDILKLKALGVDGVITDYPNLKSEVE